MTDAQAQSGRALLLDRDAELSRLHQLVDVVRRGDGAVAVVEGPPGIGKSALLGALITHARAAEFELLTARGDELERGFAFGIARQLFEPRLAALPPEERQRLLSGAAALAGPLVDPSHDLDALPQMGDAFPMLHGLYWLTAGLAEQSPLGIVVDDAHWADGPSLRWLHYLSRRLEGVPALVAVAARSTEPDTPGAEIEAMKTDAALLQPRPLTPAACGTLLAAVFGPEPAPDLVAAAHHATGGNPFLLRELGRSLVADNIRPDAAAAARLAEATPDTIVQSALHRLARLSPDARELARSAALLGEDAQLRHAATLAGLDERSALAAADQLVAAGFLAKGDPFGSRLEFAHPLIRQALDADLAAGARAARHKDAARLLAAEADPERAAAHLLQAPPAGDRWTVDALRDAAAAATRSGAPEIATGFLHRALDEPPAEAVRPGLLLELGQAEWRLMDPQAITHLELVASTARDDGQRMAALAALAFNRFYRNDSRAAFETAREALEQLPAGGGGDTEAWLFATVLWAARAVPDLVGQVAALLEQPRVGSAGEPTQAELIRVAFQAYDAFLRGRRPEALERLSWPVERADEALDAEPGPMGFALGMVQAFIGQEREAEARLRRTFEAAQGRGDKQIMGVLDLLAWLRWRRGDLAGGIADADTMLSLYALGSEDDWEQPTIWIRAMRALCLTDRGDLEAADATIDIPTEIETRLPGTWWWAWLLYARGRLAHARGDWALTRTQALAAGEWLLAIQIPSAHYMAWRSLAAEAMARDGEHDEAMSLACEELELARAECSPRAIGVALTTVGLIEGGSSGLEPLAEAVEVLSGTSDRLERARALCELGAALRRAKRRADAREPLAAAIELARACGAAALAERAHAELRATGARPRTLVFTGVEALTPRERQVAELAAEGRSNPEIAQSLFVTRKTVETHLGAVYRKLDIDSRDQLSEALTAGP